MVFSQPVSRFVHRDPVTVSPETQVLDCLRLMNEKLVGSLPVVDPEGRYLGLVSWQHAVRVLLRSDPLDTPAGCSIEA